MIGQPPDQDVTSSTEQALGRLAAAGTQIPKTRTTRRKGVPVPEEVIRDLDEHHTKLEGYLKGFLTFRTVRGMCEDVRDDIEDPRRSEDRYKFLQELRDHLNGLKRQMVFLPIWRQDFSEQLTSLEDQLQHARSTLEGPGGLLTPGASDDGVEPGIASIQSCVSTMIDEAGTIEANCRSGCEEELNEVGRYVRQVMQQLPPSAEPTPTVNKAAFGLAPSAGPIPHRTKADLSTYSDDGGGSRQ